MYEVRKGEGEDATKERCGRESRMNFIDSIKSFFKAPEVDPVAIARRDALMSASDACDAAFLAAPRDTRAALA